MAKTVSDTLTVKMSRKGEEVVVDLAKLFNDNPNRVISIVGTVNEDGTPNTAPMSLFYCPDEETVIAGMVRTSQTVTNIKRESSLIIEMLFDGDVCYGIRGRGEVIKEPLECNDATLALKIDVESVKRDTSPAQVITSGIKITPRSEKGVEYEEAVWKEILSLAESI